MQEHRAGSTILERMERDFDGSNGFWFRPGGLDSNRTRLARWRLDMATKSRAGRLAKHALLR